MDIYPWEKKWTLPFPKLAEVQWTPDGWKASERKKL